MYINIIFFSVFLLAYLHFDVRNYNKNYNECLKKHRILVKEQVKTRMNFTGYGNPLICNRNLGMLSFKKSKNNNFLVTSITILNFIKKLEIFKGNLEFPLKDEKKLKFFTNILKFFTKKQFKFLTKKN